MYISHISSEFSSAGNFFSPLFLQGFHIAAFFAAAAAFSYIYPYIAWFQWDDDAGWPGRDALDKGKVGDGLSLTASHVFSRVPIPPAILLAPAPVPRCIISFAN